MRVRKNTLISKTKAMLRAGKSISEMVAELNLPHARVYALRSKAKHSIAAENKNRLMNRAVALQTMNLATEIFSEKKSAEPVAPNDVQVGGDHYKKHKIQPWDAINDWGLGFFSGNAVKYIARHKDKGGLEDIKKARHYLDKLIAMSGDDRGSVV